MLRAQRRLSTEWDYKSETDFNGQKIIQCLTDKGGWMVNPDGGRGRCYSHAG